MTPFQISLQTDLFSCLFLQSPRHLTDLYLLDLQVGRQFFQLHRPRSDLFLRPHLFLVQLEHLFPRRFEAGFELLHTGLVPCLDPAQFFSVFSLLALQFFQLKGAGAGLVLSLCRLLQQLRGQD